VSHQTRLAWLLAVTGVVAALFATTASSAEAAGASRAERVRIPFPRDDGSLTPYTFRLGYPLVTLVYDTLLWRAPSGTPAPWLARTVRRSDEGRRVTIRLREGIRWHDGRPLTADDVAFSFGYFAKRFHPRFTPQLEAVIRTEAPDAQTVVITLRHRSPGFADQPLADVPILPRHLWERLPDGATAPKGLPVGSGPYRLAEYRRGKRYRFTANRNYFLGRPRVDKIEVPFIASFDDTIRALEARRLDMVPATIPERQQDRVTRPEFQTKSGSTYTGTVLMFNLRRAPFDRPAARRAVADALDLQRIARNPIIGGTGSAVPADRGYLHPGSGWTTLGQVYRPDLARSRRAFARLRLPPIRILAPSNDPVRREAGRQVVLALERAGASARLQELAPSRLSAAVGEDGTPPDFEAAIWSSPPLASYDPDFLRVVFGSGKLAPLNYSGYRSAAFDRLAAQVAAAVTPDDRRRLVKSEINLLARDAPAIPLFFRQGAFVFRPQIYDGWIYVAGAGILDKRSFLPRVTRAVAQAPATQPAPQAESSSGGIGVLGYLAGAIIAGVLLFVVAALTLRKPGR